MLQRDMTDPFVGDLFVIWFCHEWSREFRVDRIGRVRFRLMVFFSMIGVDSVPACRRMTWDDWRRKTEACDLCLTVPSSLRHAAVSRLITVE